VTKHSKQNIITTLRGIDTSKAELGRNNDDDDNDMTFMMKQLKPQIVSLNPNIKILPLVILLGHKSQGLHNHKHLAFCNTYT
jgi:hypothetical protein